MQAFLSELLNCHISTPQEAKDELHNQIYNLYQISLPQSTRLATLTKDLLNHYNRLDEYGLKFKQNLEVWEYGRILSYQERPVFGEYIPPKEIRSHFIPDFFVTFKGIDLPKNYYISYTGCSFLLKSRSQQTTIAKFQYPIRDYQGKLRFRFLLNLLEDKRIFRNNLPKQISNHIDNYTIRRFHRKCFIQYITLHQCKEIVVQLKKNKVQYYANQRMD